MKQKKSLPVGMFSNARTEVKKTTQVLRGRKLRLMKAFFAGVKNPRWVWMQARLMRERAQTCG
jgi:hypothetical protein